MWLLLLLFISIPIGEVLLLLEVSDQIGGMNTFSLVLATAFLGIWLTRREGKQVIFQLRKETGRGVLPAESLLHGILVFIGGVLLIIPGFITDLMGLLLLVPIARNWVAGYLKLSLQKSMREGKFQVRTFSSQGGFSAYGSSNGFPNFDDNFATTKEVREAKVIDIETKRLERLSNLDSSPK
jgi:UPF0716 protein FxsA